MDICVVHFQTRFELIPSCLLAASASSLWPSCLTVCSFLCMTRGLVSRRSEFLVPICPFPWLLWIRTIAFGAVFDWAFGPKCWNDVSCLSWHECIWESNMFMIDISKCLIDFILIWFYLSNRCRTWIAVLQLKFFDMDRMDGIVLYGHGIVVL